MSSRLVRIKKLLALSSSANDAEALSALRLAHKLALKEGNPLSHYFGNAATAVPVEHPRVSRMREIIKVAKERRVSLSTKTMGFLFDLARYNSLSFKQASAFRKTVSRFCTTDEVKRFYQELWR